MSIQIEGYEFEGPYTSTDQLKSVQVFMPYFVKKKAMNIPSLMSLSQLM
jgi:hypothetical protein